MDLSVLGAETGGVWTTAQARACGLSPEQVEGRVRRLEWQRVRHGVLADGGVVLDPVMRGWACVLATGGPGRAWAAGRTTARLLGLPLIDDCDPATGSTEHPHDDVAVQTGRRPDQRATLHVQRLRLVRGDTVRVNGCPSLSLVRAIPGLVRGLSHEALVCLLDAALHRQLLSPSALADVARTERGRPWGRRLQLAADAADGRAEAPTETLARLLLLPVLPGLVPQVELFDRGARLVARFDLGDERLRLAVESDGKRAHAGPVMAARDHRRDRRAGALGWTTERCTWFELRREQAQLVARVVATAERLRRRAG